MHPLDITYTSPIEREFEAWIVRGIEEYFSSIGHKVAIWAVSPNDEIHWPADESVVVDNKLIGLQVKKAHFSTNCTSSRDFSCLKWTFHQPPKQYDLVVSTPEIYYCLPTFLNRGFKDQALAHCLFWRPSPHKEDKNAWYDNTNAHTPYKSIKNSMRWGLFLEEVVSCSIGKRINSISDAKNYVNQLQGKMREIEDFHENASNNIHQNSKHYVYLISVPVTG